MTVLCPSCGQGEVRATFQVLVTYGLDAEGRVTEDAGEPDSDSFVYAECTNEACDVALAQEPGDGRLRNAGLVVNGEPVEDDVLLPAWVAATYAAIGHEHPEWAVTFNEDGTMTCTECGAVAPAADEVLTLTDPEG